LRGVVPDDVVRATAGDEPPDDYLATAHWPINRGDFEDVELRSAVTARISDGVTMRVCDGEFERRFDAVVQIPHQRRSRSIFVTHREVSEQIFDSDGGTLLVRLRGEGLREFTRKNRPES